MEAYLALSVLFSVSFITSGLFEIFIFYQNNSIIKRIGLVLGFRNFQFDHGYLSTSKSSNFDGSTTICGWLHIDVGVVSGIGIRI